MEGIALGSCISKQFPAWVTTSYTFLMIHVALVITELDVGGAERQLVSLATGLDRRWFKPRVYALGKPPTAGRDLLVQRLRDADVPVEFLQAKAWWQFQPTVQNLAALLREFQPHLMQSFLFHANVIGTLAARQAGVPRVSLGVRVADPSWWRSLVERRIAQGVDRVVSVSQDVSHQVRRRWRLRPEQATAIPNGIDLDLVDAAPEVELGQFGVPRGVRPLVFVGRLDRQKGVDRLPELAAILTTLDTHLLLLGDGPLRDRLARQFAAHGIANRVHFAGWQANVAGVLKGSRLLLLPSRYEGMPNVLLEAMAVGLPVLATPVEGVREILGELAEEQTLPLGTSLANWSAGIAARFHHEQDDHLGEQNRRRIESHFSLRGMISAYERLFAEMTSGLPGTTRFSGET